MAVHVLFLLPITPVRVLFVLFLLEKYHTFYLSGAREGEINENRHGECSFEHAIGLNTRLSSNYFCVANTPTDITFQEKNIFLFVYDVVIC
jgi:hypothetical protein